MHIKEGELENGSWVLVYGRPAQYIAPAGQPSTLVKVKFFGDEVVAKHYTADLRPIYLNRAIIEQCNFKKASAVIDNEPNSMVYRDAYFQVTIGGAETNYMVKAHSLKNPSFSYLLSQLHIFQKIYRQATTHNLVFLPKKLI